MLFQHEDRVVRRKELLEKFSDIGIEERNGTIIVQNMAKNLEELLVRRTKAAEKIGRHAEMLANSSKPRPRGYTYLRSIVGFLLIYLQNYRVKVDFRITSLSKSLRITEKQFVLFPNKLNVFSKRKSFYIFSFITSCVFVSTGIS